MPTPKRDYNVTLKLFVQDELRHEQRINPKQIANTLQRWLPLYGSIHKIYYTLTSKF